MAELETALVEFLTQVGLLKAPAQRVLDLATEIVRRFELADQLRFPAAIEQRAREEQPMLTGAQELSDAADSLLAIRDAVQAAARLRHLSYCAALVAKAIDG
jgi:hypothetical protein